jgi:LuxR family maltose regulon positive regulatory protein
MAQKGATMCPNNDNADQRKTLRRPRLTKLIREGLRQPLLVILAAPGYGKTQAMSDYIKASGAKALWLRLGVLDNLVTYFWDHLLRTLTREYPELSDRLRGLEFPVLISDFSFFAQCIETTICDGRQVIWIFEDYGEITDRQVKAFVRMLIDITPDCLHTVLISSALDSVESLASLTHKHSLLLADDLRFTQDEILAWYQLYDITLTPRELETIERYTEGWPLPLRLLVLQHDRLPELLYHDTRLTDRVVSRLFEKSFFSAYAEEQQKLLIRLSLLDSFTREFALSIYEGNAADLEMLASHAFFINEPNSDHLCLHHLYRLFLQEKAYLLDPREIRSLWQKAADHYLKMGNSIDAVACYSKCENYPDMIDAIYHYTRSQSEMAKSTALYFLERISLMPSEQREQYPRADYLRAYISMILVRLEESEELLLDIEKRLLADEGARDRYELLCDVYATLGLVHMMQNSEAFADDFEKAAAAADRVALKTPTNKSSLLRIHNGNAFSMADNQSGAKERMERTVYRAVPYMTRIWSGDISGLEFMFSAESAYLSFQLEKARENAYCCLYRADSHAQHDLVCNAYRLLARVGYMRGDHAEMKKQVDCAVEYANSNDNNVLRKIRDTALGWYYIELRDFAKVPKSILERSQTEAHNLDYGPPQVVYAHYLLNRGEYSRMVGMMQETDQGLYLSRGIWQERIARLILLSVGYHCLGDHDASIDALWSAYDLCNNNGLVTLFIEMAEYMNAVIQVARQQDRLMFSQDWLDLIDRESAAFFERADKIRAAYYRQNPLKVRANNQLTKREQEVLQSISLGLTREEIAAEQYVSVNTVKTTLRNIYHKLSASNNAEAVSIAIAKGYIDGHVFIE